MYSVTKQDLIRHTASVIDGVTATNEVIVTEGGEPRWRISTYDGGAHDALAAMAREGGYTPPRSNPAPWPQEPGGPRYSDADVTALLDEVRRDH